MTEPPKVETRLYTGKTVFDAKIESILLTVFGPTPRGGGGRVGRWQSLRSLARYIIEGNGHERPLSEIKYNWSAKEGLTPDKAVELTYHLLHLTGPNGEEICKTDNVGGVRFFKWVFGTEGDRE